VKEFFLDRKEDLKHIKEEAKNLFGKVKGVFAPANAKKKEEVVHHEEEKKHEAVPAQKPNGLKMFGSKVKLGFSKIFAKKEQPVKYEEHKQREEEQEEEIFANRERSSSLIMNDSNEGGEIKLIEDEDELNRLT
jgi:hypothetical protein